MKAQNQITFLAELTYLVKRLQELLDEYCHQLTTEGEDYQWEDKTGNRNMPF